MSDQPASRLEHVIAHYLQAIEAGQEPDRDSLLSEHADLAHDLRSFFQNHDVIRRVELESTSGIREKQQAALTTRQDQAMPNVEAVDHQSLAETGDSRVLPELGGYTMVRELGAGGMGQVFLALHRHMDRQVAIKFLPSELAQDGALVKRFHREAQVAARLTHINIVAAHDAGQENDIHYLVMEYVDGADLGAIVRQGGPLGLDDAIRCIVQAGKGIACAHQSGVIHRDIKPGNLLLGRDGVVKVLDMGLARWSIAAPDKTASDLSSSGMIMGTIDYLAPEQAIDSKAADQRSDLYSLGCSLYFLHRGEAIHPRDSVVEKLLAHREADPPNLVDEDDDKTNQLNEIFHKMIARKSTDRFGSVEEACAALQQWCGFSDDDLKLEISIPKPQISSPHESTVEKARAQNVDTTRMTKSPQADAQSPSRWRMAASILSVMLIGLLSIPFLIKLRTPDGTLIVKCYVEGAFVEIDEHRRVTVSDPSVKSEYSFELPPGEHRVRVTMPDGTEIRTGSVTISTGEAKLFEVGLETNKGQISKKESQKTEKVDLEPNVHTVARNGTAEHASIGSALVACRANQVIQVLDDADYVETAQIDPFGKHKGITIEFVGEAHWRPELGMPNSRSMVLGIQSSDVTIRGVNFVLDPPGYATVIRGQAENVRFEDCTFEGVGVGISLEGISILDDKAPLVITGSQFSVNIGVMVSGATNDDLTPLPCNNILISDNMFANCPEQAVLIRGEIGNLLCVDNKIRECRISGIQFQHLHSKSHNILVANNSLLQCGTSIRAWENGVPSVVVTMVNNLTLGATGIDWQAFDSGGDIRYAKPGSGESVSQLWNLHNNFREGLRQGPGWIPLSASDQLFPEIELLSRDPAHPDYLRPSPDSPLATDGAGNELPSYVGAVSPSNVPAFDWENYFTTVFRSKSKSTE